MSISYQWRGEVLSREVNELHAEAFATRVYPDEEWDWRALLAEHSLGWVTARDSEELVGFANVVSDGLVHAWLQDVMVRGSARRGGIGRQLVAVAADGARTAGCELLHVDFEDDLASFYLDACGFRATRAGLLELGEDSS